jgi:predicted metal-dependent phosphoesterase TrpH
VIDLHLHTIASDGRSTPEELVALAAAAGLTTIAVTDHDTVAGVPPARAAAGAAGLRVVTGIEITAVQDGLDIHILGYFLDEGDADLAAFLSAQRADRRRRVVEIVERLAGLGIPVAVEALMDAAGAGSGRALGRPLIAKALVEAGHARDIADAFDRYIGHGRPAFVARRGATPADVIAIIGRAGGLASFAHPGKLGLDALVPGLADAGLAAIEAFHPDHAAKDVERYQRLARDLGLVVTGGSDFHGPGSGRPDALGDVVLPLAEFEAVEARRPRAS